MPPSWLQISIVRILPGPVLLIPSVFRLKNTLFNYYTIKRNYMKGQKSDYSKVPSGSGVFAPIPEPPVLGDHSGIGILANSLPSASESPGNSPIRPQLLQILNSIFSTSTTSLVFSVTSALRLQSSTLVWRASSTNNRKDSSTRPKNATSPGT